MRNRLMAAVIVGLVTLAPAASAEPQVEHFIGSGTVLSPDGRAMQHTTRLVKRTLDPEAGTIVEQSVTIVAKPKPTAPKELIVTVRVKPDGSFTVTERNKSFTGTGALVGKPWAWHHWESHTKLPDGMTVASKNDLREGKLKATKQIFDKTARLMATAKEALTLVEAAEYEERYRNAFPKAE